MFCYICPGEESALSSTALETSVPPHFQTEETVQEAVFTHEACLASHGAGSSRMSGEIPLSGIITEHISTDVSQTLVGADIDSSKEELKSDFNKQVEKLKQTFEAEKTQMSNTYLEQIERLQNQLLETEEKYNRLQEVIEEHEGAGVEQLLKDRYDMELELAKSLMQKEFDDTLAAEKKKFVERHRQLMDGFMSEQEAEAEKIKEQHQQDLNKLQSSFTVKYATIIADLHGMIKEQRQELSVSDDECQEVSSEKELTKSKEEEKETNVKDDEYAESEDRDDLIASELHSLRLDLTELCQLVVRLKTKQQKAVDELRLQYEARLSELEAEHQDQLEAAALDTDVLKSELDCALAELESLRQTSQQTTQLKTEKMLSTGSATLNESSREALQSVSEISFALLPQFERASQSGKDGNQTPDIHSSLEYEETDEEGSLHSFSSLLGKTRSFANGVKTPLPSPEPEQRIKQLKAEIEQLTQELEQKQASILKDTTVLASSSSPPAEAAGRTGRSKESESLVAMLQSDLDRISAERDTIQQTNNRLLQLLSDSIHTYVEVEDRINRRLQTIVSASGPRPHSPCPLPLENHDNLLASGGAGAMASSYNVISKGAGIMSSPRSERSWQPGEADSSFTLEETSILSIATDEGLDVSQRLTDSIFTGPDIGAEGEEIVADARGRLQSAVSHLLDLIGQTTQQLMEAKKTQADLLESLAARSNDSNIMAARIQDLEEQFRQEVSAKEYFSLELHKAEGLIKGYSSEREAMEEQIQLLEEQKEVLAQSLETTRSQLQDFQDAAGELEARRQDVERHQILLQQNAGQEAQESSMTGGDATKSEEQALLVEVNMVKQERREQTLQLQHRLDQTQQSLQDREATLEEMERVFQRQREEMREQLEDLRLQLENTERQLKSNKQFLDEQMNERELEREEFQREIEKLRQQVQDKDKQEGSHVSLHREIQDLTEHLHVRVEREAVMHQRMQELQQTLQDRDLSAQDLRIWITTLEKELDQQGDVEQQLKDRIQKLEQQLSQEDGDAQSVRSSSPVATPRPGSSGSLNLSLNQPTTQQAISYVSLEEELRKSRQAEEELTHEKEALKNTVQQQLLQISALRNQLDDLRHWRGPPEPSSTTSTTANLRDELESEREEVQKKEEKIIELKSTQENLEKQLAVKQRELEQLTKHLEEMQHKFVSVDHIVELERERDSLKSRVGELSAAHAFPPALLEEKNAEIDELRLQLNKTEAHLKEKEELISDLQDTMLSLQRGETCLDVSLPFNEPVSLNASFTERPPAVVEQPSLLTTLAQELDQTVSERETEVAELTTQVDRLTREVMHVKEQLQEAVAALHQKEEDLSQLQEEKVQKQEAMVEKDSRLEQLMVQVKSLQTEITSLTAFQMELQKDYDTVQNMLEEKEQEIESLTREYLETRSQPDGSDVAELETELVVAQKKLQEQGNIIEEKEEELYELRDQLEAMDSLKEEVKSLSAILAEKEVELQKVKKLYAEAQRELKELQVTRHDHADHPPDDALRSLEEQISKLKAEVHHLEESVKDKEEFIRNLEEEKSSELDSYEKESAAIRLHLTEALNEQTTKVTQLEIQLADKACSLQQAESIRDQVLQAKEKEATIFHETLQSKTEIIEKLENEVMSLQHQITEKDLCITELKVKSQELQDQVKEMSHLEEQLHQLSSVPKNAATDEGKALQNELAQASEKLITLTQQLTETQIHLEQTSSQLAEKRDHIQQLQAEIQTLQLQAHHQHTEDKELNVTPESFSYLKTQESSDDGELHDDGLKDFLAKAQQMQMTVNESLSASLPMSSEMSRLSRWDSEPGLSSTYPTELVSLTFGTETWMRRQQKEMAAKNRELALLREELEGWLRRKGTSRDSTISTSTLQKLHEKESLIISLKRELIETKALLVSAEKRAAETSDNFFSMELTPQTKQQIAHLRSELRLAKAALTALQKHSQRDGLTSDVDKEASHEEQDRSQKLEAEHQLHKSSAIVSTKDFLQKVQELREEITLEHQKHIQDIQEAARQDAEMKMTEMQVRHDHEVQQLRSHHERKLEQALTHQQQELEKQHKTELNSLRVQHQQEIDRLRSEELASLTDGSVVSRLRADVGETQQMDEHLIGSFALRADGSSQDDLSTAETSSIMSGSEEALPSRLQALLTRLRQAGDHILSISELNFLLQHLTPQGEVSCQTLQEAFEGEKSSLVKTANALKALLSQADRVGSGLQDTVEDWRSELLHALVEVYQHERLVLEAELYTLRLQHSSTSTEDALKHFDNRLREQEQLHQSGLNAMLRAERQSLLAELDDLHARLVRQRTEQQEQQLRLSEALAKMEEQASNKEWKLQREVQVLEYKLQQEKVIEDDLRKGLEAERRHTTELSAELSRSKAALTSLQSELQTTQIQLSRTKDALEREQQRFTSVTGEWSTCLDALEEERQKNNRLAEMLETLRRQQHNLETELGRKEAIYKERESTESKIIKELRAELASQREQLRKTSESAEKERRERQQAQTAANEAEQTTLTLRHEVDKVQHQTKKVLEGESIKLQELQNMLKQEQHQVTELQESLEDRDSIIARLTREVNKSEDLHGQVQQLQRSLSSTEHHLETERQKVRDLTNLLDKEHEERGSVLQRESELTKQMRSELNALKAETSDVRHQLELETSRAEGLHLELERAQSELRAVTQHSGATERQLQAEQTITWSKLRAAQHEKDELQIKVHQLELELERMQEKLQDLELELDRSHQRELEARHDIERYKLYPSVSPRMAFSDCQAESSDTQMQARLSAFLRQLQAIGDRLQVLVVRQHNHNSATCNVNNSGETIGNKDSCSVESLLQELQVLQGKMSERDQLDGGDFNQIVELEQLKMRVTTLIKEKKELQHRLDLLQNEDNIRTPSKASGTNTTASTSSRQRKQQPVAIPQYLSDAPSDDEAIYERTIWASERLNLQMALDSAEHEIDRLKKELRLFRGRYDAEGFVMEADRDKMQRLYGKYLRAESFRKALVYQKKYLLLLLGGYQDSEQETLAIIATMGGQPSSTLDLAYRRGHRRLYTIFRSAARTVVAIFRMKYLVRKWKRATRVGSPIVSGRVNQQYGYVATPQSFTQPNFVDHPDDHCSTPSATSLYVHTLTRGSSNGNAVSLHSHNPISRLTDDGGASGDYSRVRFNTPPTKEFTHPLRPSSSHLSTSARRPLLHVLDPSENARSSVTADSGVPMGAISGDAAHTFGGGGDDFIQRLENLQSRLSSQNGATPKRPAWR
ncbi:A-kinase anchor protein 9-like isoform X3 [Pomacea canaliculata]|uniref:A-kinase anchor protein 9-like isoform X3 n=1 Tax=Pomacea canaliculata TaxID=400727 RepID=UPI000D73CC55|nr:A-kinase anchor protein 9-like isoform X3 [Pomacea canaliculata]